MKIRIQNTVYRGQNSEVFPLYSVSYTLYSIFCVLRLTTNTGRAVKVKEEKGLGWAIYFVVGTQLAVSVIAGLLLGHYVDKWIGTKTPWFTFIGLIAGVISGFSLLIRIMKRKDDK